MAYRDPEAQRAYQREWVAKRRQQWLDANGPCAKCGSTVDLEVDHIDPSTKSMDPGQVWSRSASIRKSELAKCQVLCTSCHKEKTRLYGLSTLAHGTYAMRNHHKCPCEECKEYVREIKRRSRGRHHAANARLVEHLHGRQD